MSERNPKLLVLEKALSNEFGFFMSMSDEEIENHIPDSRIKQRVKKIGKYEVYIYTRDHDPPHFHIISKDGSLNAKFRIEDGSLMTQYGDLRSSVLKRINLWYSDIKTRTIIKKIWDKRKG